MTRMRTDRADNTSSEKILAPTKTNTPFSKKKTNNNSALKHRSLYNTLLHFIQHSKSCAVKKPTFFDLVQY